MPGLRREDTEVAQQECNMVQAIPLALASEMARDENVVVLGQDVGRNGGVFRATVGLQERFGAGRVIDMPLAEALIAGMAIGMATQGLRPVAEIQFSGFIYPALDHIHNQAVSLRSRSAGRLTCPLVLRAPNGGGIHAPEHHEESVEATFAHIPGLRVVIPSTPARAYGLLLAAIRDPDPLIFLEPTRCYRMFREPVEDNGEALPLDQAFVERTGSDVTLISWGGMMGQVRDAADQLAAEGVQAEVIDVATLKPLDTSTLLRSVAKTGRCVIVQESPRAGGWASEIAAEIAEHAIEHLLAPVVRVSGHDTLMPPARNVDRYIPSVAQVLRGVRRVLDGGVS